MLFDPTEELREPFAVVRDRELLQHRPVGPCDHYPMALAPYSHTDTHLRVHHARLLRRRQDMALIQGVSSTQTEPRPHRGRHHPGGRSLDEYKDEGGISKRAVPKRTADPMSHTPASYTSYPLRPWSQILR